MFTALFDSTAYGWACSIGGGFGGGLFILALAWLAKIQQRAVAEGKLDATLFHMFEELQSAIETGEVGESVFVAWMKSVPYNYTRSRSAHDATPFITRRLELQKAMRHQKWHQASIDQFSLVFASITVEEIAILLPDRR